MFPVFERCVGYLRRFQLKKLYPAKAQQVSVLAVRKVKDVQGNISLGALALKFAVGFAFADVAGAGDLLKGVFLAQPLSFHEFADS